ncbi:arsenate reductase [Ceratocystis lukuohia]|uniref:Arsenate reductase n=1 Tax=Ceratocystis lukuohia TaxID=2019550 RepID=A0ABR4MJP5_9PEZI
MSSASELPPVAQSQQTIHPKRDPACAECALAKAKCLRSNTAPGSKCNRCQRLGKECTKRPRKVRKKRQSKPSRTAQLEERLNSLIKQLQPCNINSPDLSTSGSALGSTPASYSFIDPRLRAALPSPRSIPAPHTGHVALDTASLPHYGPTLVPKTYNSNGPNHCICRPAHGEEAPGPLDSDEALLRIYREELMPAYPFVIISKQTTPAELQATRPFLLACIRMVASFRSLRSMHGQMYHLMAYISDRMLIRSERSMDLLAGIVVMLAWYNHYCFMHCQLHNLMSLSMTLVGELGLRKPPGWQERTKLMVVNLKAVKERTNDERRLLLAQCLGDLEQTKELDSDAYLVSLVKIQYITERIVQLGGYQVMGTEPNGLSRAPVSGYISALQAELDTYCAKLPQRLRHNRLLKIQINSAQLRLNEPPRVDANLLSALSSSFATPSLPGDTPSPLDGFYRSHAALKAWFDDFMTLPIPSYYCIPLPVSMNMIHAVTILGRWAKLSTPYGHLASTPQPEDPSGAWNNPLNEPKDSASSTLDDSILPTGDSRLIRTLAMLKAQISTQPSLSLDVTGIMEILCNKLEQASSALSARDIDSQAQEYNVWIFQTTKLRIAHFKLQQWAEIVAGQQDEECEFDDGSGDDYEDDDGDYDDDGGDGKATAGNGTDRSSHDASVNAGSAGAQATNVAHTGRLLTAELCEGLEPSMLSENWDDWALNFDPNMIFS